ncbi:hypothetical protein PF005_g18360 [Phytophthora fragariae]|uniref:Uncharacterized protein n=1 Tax=Phytophthora fragariae TaxID=53985 RepID=A0A6A3EAH8_9STRA|nr:hypothetical protein PF009_g19357 [Phytophthora fragariae]KAE9094116.1 hypothetical protein PF007_g17877 [Phytophthora fragariae]KAE9192704.1 hypothetical protein PF005_g18360 [Phytophthora fragariae]
MALFSEAELLDVLTGIDAGSTRDDGLGPSVDVVLSEDALSSEKAFEEFMESLASDDDAAVSRVSDGSQSEATSTSSPPASSTSSKRKVDAAASTVKPKRKRRKHELDHLRAVAAELEKKLKALNQPLNEEQTGANHVWKHISSQMMTERQKSVGENARLRQLVREQVKSVKAMQRTLEKTPDLSKMGFGAECSGLNPAAPRQPPTSKELYRDLFKNISSSYSNGAENLLLQQQGMPTPSPVVQRKMNMEMETVGERGPQMCLQFVESRLIPFGLRLIGDHAWEFLSGSSGHENFQMATSFSDIARRTTPPGLYKPWATSRFGGTSIIRIRQKGWCVFEPSEEDPQNATIFRACARMTPQIADSNSFTDSAKAVGQTTEMIIENYEKTVVYIFDAVLDSLTSDKVSKVV